MFNPKLVLESVAENPLTKIQQRIQELQKKPSVKVPQSPSTAERKQTGDRKPFMRPPTRGSHSSGEMRRTAHGIPPPSIVIYSTDPANAMHSNHEPDAGAHLHVHIPLIFLFSDKMPLQTKKRLRTSPNPITYHSRSTLTRHRTSMCTTSGIRITRMPTPTGKAILTPIPTPTLIPTLTILIPRSHLPLCHPRTLNIGMRAMLGMHGMHIAWRRGRHRWLHGRRR